MKKTLMALGFITLMSALSGSPGCKNDSGTTSYGTPPPPPPASNTVTMPGLSFSPSTLTVTKGTTITWKNTDATAHTSTSETSGIWDTGNIPAGSSATTTFNTAGTFGFHCTYHSAMGMTGTITVR